MRCKAEVLAALKTIESITGKGFGDAANPLLVSVRSGARVSMPGMMDTVLNLGLNDVTVEGLATFSANPRFAWDSYRRFIQMYGDVVLGLDHYLFEDALEFLKEDRGVTLDTELSAEDLRGLVDRYKAIVAAALGQRRSRRTRMSSCGAPSARCSDRGGRTGRAPIAG